MKVIESVELVNKFTPFTINLTIENEDELFTLLGKVNLNWNTVVESTVSYNFKDVKSADTIVLWRFLRDKIEEFGIAYKIKV